MKDDIRKQTCIVIRKNGMYLAGKKWFSNELNWTWSVYEAWKTRNREEAAKVARETGGILVLWNPIVNRKKVLGT